MLPMKKYLWSVLVVLAASIALQAADKKLWAKSFLGKKAPDRFQLVPFDWAGIPV